MFPSYQEDNQGPSTRLGASPVPMNRGRLSVTVGWAPQVSLVLESALFHALALLWGQPLHLSFASLGSVYTN